MYTPSQLSAIEEIRQLKSKYFRMMDTKNWDAWRTVFADDMVLDVDVTVPDADGEVIKSPTQHGAEAVVQSVSALLKDMRTVHHGHMFELTQLSDSQAEGVWAMEDIVEGANGKLHGYGHYHEKYKKIDGQWLIAYSHLTRLRLDITGDFEKDVAAAAFLD